MLVAVEAFLDHESDMSNETQLFRRFGEYVETLGTQPVTITISSLIEDMLDTYANVSRGIGTFSWKHNLVGLIRDLIATRDCFYYTNDQAPVLYTAFSVTRYGPGELDVSLHYESNPPTVDFQDLNNVAAEGREVILKPTIRQAPGGGVVEVSTEYFASESDWLHWDSTTDCFRGVVPSMIASYAGAKRFSAYTVPIEFTARITKHFPGQMQFEKRLSCAIPLTIKRTPSKCLPPGLTSSSQAPLQRPSSAKLYATISEGVPRSRDRGSFLSTRLGRRELCKLLDKKAQFSASPSPFRTDSLRLAELHDALRLSHPPPGTDLEVRMLHTVHDQSKSTAAPAQQPPTPKTPIDQIGQRSRVDSFGKMEENPEQLTSHGKAPASEQHVVTPSSSAAVYSPSPDAGPSTRQITLSIDTGSGVASGVSSCFGFGPPVSLQVSGAMPYSADGPPPGLAYIFDGGRSTTEVGQSAHDALDFGAGGPVGGSLLQDSSPVGETLPSTTFNPIVGFGRPSKHGKQPVRPAPPVESSYAVGESSMQNGTQDVGIGSSSQGEQQAAEAGLSSPQELDLSGYDTEPDDEAAQEDWIAPSSSLRLKIGSRPASRTPDLTLTRTDSAMQEPPKKIEQKVTLTKEMALWQHRMQRRYLRSLVEKEVKRIQRYTTSSPVAASEFLLTAADIADEEDADDESSGFESDV